ncbi:MAG: ATP-dependent RNA helicase [Parcubacteria group bacterium]|nr:ATP-dependent RNA helicase [Parcubacteria group bacterium]
MRLPIQDFQELIVQTVRSNQVTIVVGETGSGKTTQIPQFLYNADFADRGMIGVTEPRRLAAISMAKFVSDQLGVFLGDEVGYQIRFDDSSAEETKIKFMTDGILLREFQLDQNLTKYSVIMVDEAHERSKNIDFVLGLLKDLLTRRKDLRLVVASATIDEKKFSRYFWDAPIINVSGRMFPVETVWSNTDIYEDEMADAVVQKIAEIHQNKEPGDILAFMTGQDDIHKVIEKLEKLNLSDFVVIPVYAALPPEEQQKIFASYKGKRKVVVATNIAETSITVDGIVYVVDSGLIKQSNFHPESGIQSLDVVKHSQAGCEQRKGRAGRTRNGVCYRMYTKENFQSRFQFTKPEICRTSLASVVLAMEDIGIEKIQEFDFIDPPKKEAFTEAYETLIALGAINKDEKGLTEIGKAMARFPLEPRIARMLLEAMKHGCVQNVATIAAFLSVRNIFVRPKEKEAEADRAHAKFKNQESDALTFLNIWKEYENAKFSYSWCFERFLNAKALQEALNIRAQIFQILFQNKIELSESSDNDAIAKTVAIGLAYNLFQHGSRYWFNGVLRSIENVAVHPSSAIFGNRVFQWIVATEIVRTTKVWARGCAIVKAEWLPEIAPNLFQFGDPIVEGYTLKEDTANIKTLILYKGQSVGDVRSKVSITQAAQIQEDRILEAEEKGLIPLTFFEKKNSVSDYLTDWFAELNGIFYRACSISGIKNNGETHYCKVENWISEKYATPVFQVFNFPAGQNKDKTISELPIVFEKLSKKWRAKLKQ